MTALITGVGENSAYTACSTRTTVKQRMAWWVDALADLLRQCLDSSLHLILFWHLHFSDAVCFQHPPIPFSVSVIVQYRTLHCFSSENMHDKLGCIICGNICSKGHKTRVKQREWYKKNAEEWNKNILINIYNISSMSSSNTIAILMHTIFC